MLLLSYLENAYTERLCVLRMDSFLRTSTYTYSSDCSNWRKD